MDVLLLHGLGADHRAFQRFARLLPSAWRTHAIDLLGHGTAPKPEAGYSLEAHAAHVLAALERVAPGGEAALVGHSYGAATAVAAAAAAPERVSAITLLDPIVGLTAHREGSGTSRMIEARRSGTLEATVAAMFPGVSDALRDWTVQTWEAMALGVVDELDPDWTRFAEAVTCPVTIIHGELEHGGAGDLAADWFTDPRVVPIVGAGHYLHATHAREVAAAVAAALDLAS